MNKLFSLFAVSLVMVPVLSAMESTKLIDKLEVYQALFKNEDRNCQKLMADIDHVNKCKNEFLVSPSFIEAMLLNQTLQMVENTVTIPSELKNRWSFFPRVTKFMPSFVASFIPNDLYYIPAYNEIERLIKTLSRYKKPQSSIEYHSKRLELSVLCEKIKFNQTQLSQVIDPRIGNQLNKLLKNLHTEPWPLPEAIDNFLNFVRDSDVHIVTNPDGTHSYIPKKNIVSTAPKKNTSDSLKVFTDKNVEQDVTKTILAINTRAKKDNEKKGEVTCKQLIEKIKTTKKQELEDKNNIEPLQQKIDLLAQTNIMLQTKNITKMSLEQQEVQNQLKDQWALKTNWQIVSEFCTAKNKYIDEMREENTHLNGILDKHLNEKLAENVRKELNVAQATQATKDFLEEFTCVQTQARGPTMVANQKLNELWLDYYQEVSEHYALLAALLVKLNLPADQLQFDFLDAQIQFNRNILNCPIPDKISTKLQTSYNAVQTAQNSNEKKDNKLPRLKVVHLNSDAKNNLDEQPKRVSENTETKKTLPKEKKAPKSPTPPLEKKVKKGKVKKKIKYEDSAPSPEANTDQNKTDKKEDSLLNQEPDEEGFFDVDENNETWALEANLAADLAQLKRALAELFITESLLLQIDQTKKEAVSTILDRLNTHSLLPQADKDALVKVAEGLAQLTDEDEDSGLYKQLQIIVEEILNKNSENNLENPDPQENNGVPVGRTWGAKIGSVLLSLVKLTVLSAGLSATAMAAYAYQTESTFGKVFATCLALVQAKLKPLCNRLYHHWDIDGLIACFN
jgi:hypothetical protein